MRPLQAASHKRGTAAGKLARRRTQPRRRFSGALRLVLRALVGVLCSLLCATGTLLGVGGAVAYAGYTQLSRDLPSPDLLGQRHQFQTTRIYDRNGVLLYEFYDPQKGKRTEVSLRDLPPHVVNAFLAAEDARFYSNSGVDPVAIARALRDNWRSAQEGEARLTGASTITQQLVKNSLLSDERTWTRKVREAILAVNVSRRYSKDQILELYLNTVYFGNQAYGIEAAAETYFDKPARALSPAQAALLAGLLPSPSSYDPFRDLEAARGQQRRVAEALALHHYLTEDEAAALLAEPLQLTTPQVGEIKAPHFVFWIRDLLESNPKFGKQGLYERGLQVTTTLDVRLQEAAEQIVRDHVAGLGSFNVHDGALVALNPATGEVLAMVGSADYANKAIQGEVNVALAPRQPGSSIKPLTYLAAFLKGWSPSTVVEDADTVFPVIPPYRPKNYDGQFHGQVTLRTALANSYNIPAVKTLQFVGVPGLVDLARRVGITTLQDPTKYGLALTLGGGEVKLLELTGAYGVLATGGQRVPPVGILKVTDGAGNTLERYPGPRPQAVVDPAPAYLVTSILSDNQARTPAFGANSPLRLSRPAAVKTGTTDDFRDNWTLGYTSQLAVGVWVGNADNQPMRGTTGLTGAAPIWHDFMELALRPLPVDPLPAPPGLQRVAVGRTSGRLWLEGCPEPKLEDYFVAGSAPRERCEAPTPVPTPTIDPVAIVVTAQAAQPTATTRPTWSPAPTIEELRAHAVATATAAAGAYATRVAERRGAVPTLPPYSTPTPRTLPALPTAQPALPLDSRPNSQVAGARATPAASVTPAAMATPAASATPVATAALPTATATATRR